MIIPFLTLCTYLAVITGAQNTTNTTDVYPQPIGLEFDEFPVYSLENIAMPESLEAEANESMRCTIQGDELTAFFCHGIDKETWEPSKEKNDFERLTIVDSRSLFNRQNCLDECVRDPIPGQPMTYDWIKYYPEPRFYENPVIDVQSNEYSLAFLKHDSIEAHYWNPKANYLNNPWSTFKLNIAFEYPADIEVDTNIERNAE